MRLFAVAALVGALLAHIDADRLQAQVARVAPRSALTCALAARLMPTLERDARAIAETARLRGVALSDGRWGPAPAAAAPLAIPLLGSSLERGLDVAEAMTARGYGAGPRTRRRRARRYRAAERGGPGDRRGSVRPGRRDDRPRAWPTTRFYPTPDPVRRPGRRVAAAALAALGGAALVLRR